MNEHKVTELRSLLGDKVWLLTLRDFPEAPAVAETGATFTANAVLKAEAICAHTGLPSLADDSGLEVDALGGAPGIYSARYAGPGASDEDNRRKLLAALAHVSDEKRTARFVCAVALAVPHRPTWTAIGTHHGYITRAPTGSGGFGYDPLFYSPELQATFAAVPAERKNAVSHRARALAQLKAYLDTLCFS
jgi:XTP/dITP diphosphohydrolase